MMPAEDRRSFRRVAADVLARPVGPLGRGARLADPQRVGDISGGGLRVYSDRICAPGERLEMEVLFRDGASATVTAEVVWVENLPPNAPARHDVGLRYVEVRPADLERIRAVLGPAEG